MLTSVAMTEQAPYKTIITHGFAVDSNGHKMSKSLGNIIAPKEIVNKFGADVLRLWVASTDYQREIRVGMENFDRVADTYRRVRNTIRYLLANISDFDASNPEHKLDLENLLAIDKWLVNRTYQIQDLI